MKNFILHLHRIKISLCLTMGILYSFQGLAQQDSIPTNQLAATPWVNGRFTVSQQNSRTGLAGWTGTAPRAVDNNTTNFATATVVLGGSATIRVKDNNSTTEYSAGNYAGFLIRNANLLSTGLLSSITIRTYLNDTIAETVSSSNLLAIGTALAGSYEVGFYTKQKYNQIEITFSGVAESFDVFYAIQRAFKAGVLPACNVATNFSLPTYPVVVNEGSFLLAGVTNANNVVSPSTTDYASISTVLGQASLGVRDQISTHPAGYFAGFEVENSSLINLSLLSGITVETYLDGVQVESSGAAGLLSVGLLTGGRQKVGFITSQPFDEVRLITSAGLGITGPLNVYNAVVQRYCEGPALACNTPVALTVPSYPVLVNYARTSSSGILCVGCSITGAENVLSGSTTPATLSLAAGVGSSGSFSVKKAGTRFAGGEYVGYDIASASLLNVGALGGVSITTYRNNVVVDTYNSSSLAVSAGLLSGANRQMIGVVTKTGAGKDFDEVQITFNNVVNVNLGAINIYSFVAERYCPVTVVCDTEYPLIRPNFPAVIESSRTGITSVACVGCSVSNSGNLVDSDLTNSATISVPVGVDLGTAASISVRTPQTQFVGGSFAGFTIKNEQVLVAANLLPSLQVTTYLNGVQQEVSTSSNLIDLTLLVPILGAAPGVYNVGFRTAADKPFDEIRLSVSSLASVLNFTQVYAPFVKACAPVLTFNTIPTEAYLTTPYTTASSVATISDNQPLTFAVSEGALPAGLQLNVPVAGAISGTPQGPTGLYSFRVQASSPAEGVLGAQDYAINVSTALPVKLISFRATKEGQTASLSWATTEEVNSDRFEVERSVDAKKWYVIGTKKSGGSGSSIENYSFADPNPLFGANLYRLKMLDLDGTFTYSKIESLDFEGQMISLSPNPVVNSGEVKIQVKDWSQVKSLKILNAMGQIVFESKGEISSFVKTDQFRSGLYIVQITRIDGQKVTSKFVKM